MSALGGACLFLSCQSLFPGPPFEKTDRAGAVSTLQAFFLNFDALRPSDRRPEAFGFTETNHTAFRGMSQTVCAQRKDRIQLPKTIGIFFFFLRHRK